MEERGHGGRSQKGREGMEGLRRREDMEAEGRFFLWLALLLLCHSHPSSMPPLHSYNLKLLHQNLHPVNREAEAKESNYILLMLAIHTCQPRAKPQN